MATNQLTKIAELTDRAGRLTGKQRGMAIEADDWNALVDVVRGILAIDRAQEDGTQAALDQRYAAKQHEHLGQVTSAWLDPALQGTVGGATDSASRIQLAALQQQVQGLAATAAQLAAQIEDQRRLVDKFSVNDSDRAHALQGIDARFATLDLVQTQVTGLSAQMAAVGGKLGEVLDLRRSLTDAAGAPIDVAKLRDQVGALATLTDNLRGADGNPVRLRDVELSMRELRDAVGVGGATPLDVRLATAAGDLEARLDEKSKRRLDALQAQLITAQQESAAQLDASTRASVAAALATVDDSVAVRSAESEARLNASLNASLTAQITASRDAITVQTSATLDQRLGGLPDQIASAVATAQETSETRLGATLSAQVNAAVTTQLAAAEGRLGAQIGAVSAQEASFEQRAALGLQQALAAQGAALRDDLTGELGTRVTDLQRSLDAQVGSQVAAAVTASSARIDAQIATAVSDRTADLDARVARAVSAATAGLPDQIQTAVTHDLAALDVAGQVQKSRDAVTTQLRAEIGQAVADQQVRSSAAIAGLATQLRGETAAAVQAASDSAFQRAQGLVAAVRTDVSALSSRVTSEVARLEQRTGPTTGTVGRDTVLTTGRG